MTAGAGVVVVGRFIPILVDPVCGCDGADPQLVRQAPGLGKDPVQRGRHVGILELAALKSG